MNKEDSSIFLLVKNEKEILQYQANIDKYTKALKNLYMDKVNEIIGQEEFLELSTDIRKDKENIEKLLADKKRKLDELDNEQEVLKTKQDILEKYINVTELTREMTENLIDYIVVGQKDPVTKKKEIEIHWKI